MAKMFQCETCKLETINYNRRQRPRYCSRRCYGHAVATLSHPNLIQDYFAIVDTKEKAYWLGFLYADGSVVEVSNQRTKILQLKLAIKDECHIDLFLSAVGGNPEKKTYSSQYSKRAVRVDIGHQAFVTHLIHQGCVPRKSRIVQLPIFIDDRLSLAFLLGYFDGDGKISQKYFNPILCSGSVTFLEQVLERYSASGRIVRQVNHKGSCFYLCLGRELYRSMVSNYDYGLRRKRVRDGPLERRQVMIDNDKTLSDWISGNRDDVSQNRFTGNAASDILNSEHIL